jgi:phosphohistidine phosphatase SixA
MERRLILMRHAKSSWKSEVATDHARPLNKRGKKDAPRVAARLVQLGWAPEMLVASDSERTRQTWAKMEPAFEKKPNALFTRRLYLAGIGEVKSEMTLVPPDVRTLMLLGHNDGWEEVLTFLTGEDHRLTTAAAALLLSRGATWAEAWNVAPRWKIQDILRPKELPA